MNPEEAKRLAVRIANSWHGGPNIEAWTEELLDMDAGTAGTTFIRLRRDLDHAPSIANFWRTYRTLVTPANEALPCNNCDGTGWVSAPPVVRVINDRPHEYRQATPCPYCAQGQRCTRIDMRPHGPGFAALDAARARHPTAHT
jgi:hypothetical protein